MISVTSATKNKYKGSSNKVLTIAFPNLNVTFTNEDIDQESFTLEEILESGEYLQFVGCNSTKATFTLLDISTDYKGQYVTISIKADNTETISLFHGYIDSQTTKDYTTGTTEFVAYDVLYSLASRDVSQFYNNIIWSNGITMGTFRFTLFGYLGLNAVYRTLPNDQIEMSQQYEPAQLNALSLIKSICQANGVYGRINRSGVFEYMDLPIISTADDEVEYYKALDYQRYSVSAIDKVIIRQTDQETGVSYGNGSNAYIMQGNFFTYNALEEDLLAMATNIYSQVAGRVYVPFNAEIEGYPWVEVGDVLQYDVYDYSTNTTTPMNFYVLKRTLKGIQSIMDSQSAEGDKERNIFVSDINLSVETIKADITEIKKSLEQKTIKSYQAINGSGITVTSNTTIMDFTPFRHFNEVVTDFVFEGEIIVDVTTSESTSGDVYTITPATITLEFELNGNSFSYTPTFELDDGTHSLSVNYQFAGLSVNTRTDLIVKATVTNGTASILAGDSVGYLWAQNLTELEMTGIYCKTLPTKTTYVQGESLDLIGCEIYGEYNDGTEEDITSLCTFSPANGDTLTDEGTITVMATYGEYETAFGITVEAMDFLKYVVYTQDSNNYYVTNLNYVAIEADGVHNLYIPSTYADKTVVLSG